jgi:hypothetical protein
MNREHWDALKLGAMNALRLHVILYTAPFVILKALLSWPPDEPFPWMLKIEHAPSPEDDAQRE